MFLQFHTRYSLREDIIYKKILQKPDATTISYNLLETYLLLLCFSLVFGSLVLVFFAFCGCLMNNLGYIGFSHSLLIECKSHLYIASDKLEFLPSWDSVDQDLLSLYRYTLVDHMDVLNLKIIPHFACGLWIFWSNILSIQQKRVHQKVKHDYHQLDTANKEQTPEGYQQPKNKAN